MKNTHNFLLDNYWVKEGLYKNIKVASKDYFEQCVKLFKDNIKKTIYFLFILNIRNIIFNSK